MNIMDMKCALCVRDTANVVHQEHRQHTLTLKSTFQNRLCLTCYTQSRNLKKDELIALEIIMEEGFRIDNSPQRNELRHIRKWTADNKSKVNRKMVLEEL